VLGVSWARVLWSPLVCEAGFARSRLTDAEVVCSFLSLCPFCSASTGIPV
jgi:hypothetical protein